MLTEQLLAAIAALVPGIQARAALLDAEEAFPAEDIADLHRVGAFRAVLPTALGGLGAGTEPDGFEALLGLLTAIGQGSLALGRLFEAHVNAVRLVVLYGTADQLRLVQKTGGVFGLWVTDMPGQGLTWDGAVLRGCKGPCSGAGHVPWALVTVGTAEGTRLAMVELAGLVQVTPMRGMLPGMRAATQGVVAFDGPLPASALVGAAGDYLREPDFSCGAWRTSAVTLGGLLALRDAARAQLVQKRHDGAPLQQERFGQLLMAVETARLWTAAAARYAEQSTAPDAERIAYVNLARLAVEAAGLSAMTLVQRSLGFGAFLRPNPVERLCRDLSVYLRQPAPDDVLLEAARHGLTR